MGDLNEHEETEDQREGRLGGAPLLKFAWSAVPLLLAGATWFAATREAEERPVAVFAELDGTWEGEFVGWDLEGRELYRIRVRQVYETVDDTTQTVTIEDHMPDGEIIRGTGRNVAVRGEDGKLTLTCVVETSNGDRVEHTGRLGRGPGGDEVLFWTSAAPERREVFREAVSAEDGKKVYTIDGVGRYGASTVFMAGRYERR